MANFKKTELLPITTFQTMLGTTRREDGEEIVTVRLIGKIDNVVTNFLDEEHHLFVKITGEPFQIIGNDDKLRRYIPVEVHYDGYDPVICNIMFGKRALIRLNEKYPQKEYIGKYAFVSQTKFMGKNVQFINPLMKENTNWQERQSDKMAKLIKKSSQPQKEQQKFTEEEKEVIKKLCAMKDNTQLNREDVEETFKVRFKSASKEHIAEMVEAVMGEGTHE